MKVVYVFSAILVILLLGAAVLTALRPDAGAAQPSVNFAVLCQDADTALGFSDTASGGFWIGDDFVAIRSGIAILPAAGTVGWASSEDSDPPITYDYDCSHRFGEEARP